MDIKPTPRAPLPKPELVRSKQPDLVLAISPAGGYSVGYRRGQFRVVQYGRAADGKHKTAVLNGFTKAVELAAGRSVLFGIFPHTSAHMVKEAVEMMPNMTMGYFRQGPHKELFDVLPRNHPTVPLEEPQPQPLVLDVYTDASIGRTRTAGLGWVITDGEGNTTAGNRACIVSDGISLAELMAIGEGVRAALRIGKPEKITIHSDSQAAVTWMNAPVRPTTSHASVIAKMVAGIHARIPEGTELAVKWVRGHAGDVGNESADRMALAARRLDHAGLSAEQAKRVQQNIVEDITSQMAA